MHTHPQFRRAGIQFRALGNERRLCILSLLYENDYSVDELRKILHVGQPSITEHLRRLQAAGFVFGKREKQRVYFSLTEDVLRKPRIREFVRSGLL